MLFRSPDRYQDEIEEILKSAGETPPSESTKELEIPPEDRRALPRAGQRPQAPGYRPRTRWPTISPGKILLLGLIIIVITSLLGMWKLVWIGLGLLVVGYLLFFITPRSINVEKRWRGQSLEEGGTSAWDKVKRWMKS